jgi:hypothetical protein
MADEDSRRDAPIDLQSASSIRMWCRRFGVTPVQLKAAVATVGSAPDLVWRYLEEHRQPTQRDELEAAERDLGLRE